MFRILLSGSLLTLGSTAANAASVAPTDYFTQVQLDGVLNYDSGQSSELSSYQSEAGSLNWDPITGQIVLDGDGVKLSGGSATGQADLYSASLHSSAGASFENATPGYNGVGFGQDALASLGDTLFFKSKGASESDITVIKYKLLLDGSMGTIPGYACGSPSGCGGLGHVQFLLLFGNTVSFPEGFSPTAVNVYQSASNYVEYFGGGDHDMVSETLTGSFSFVGDAASIPIYMQLLAGGQHGFADFSNTAKLIFDVLPDGVSFSSASGAFMLGQSSPTAPVPLPASISLLTAAIGGLGAVSRRRAA